MFALKRYNQVQELTKVSIVKITTPTALCSVFFFFFFVLLQFLSNLLSSLEMTPFLFQRSETKIEISKL